MLQWVASLTAAARGWSQSTAFPGPYANTLRGLAALVLPSSLGQTATDRIADQFIRYVREYRPGADTDHGYGNTHVRPKPPSPAPEYLRQLAALPVPLTKAAVESAVESAQVRDLPRIPDGKSVVVDLMSFYFRSSDANDLCYSANIQRDKCRGLEGSSKQPAPLRKQA